MIQNYDSYLYLAKVPPLPEIIRTGLYNFCHFYQNLIGSLLLKFSKEWKVGSEAIQRKE